MKVLVAGSNGFIGSLVCKELLKRRYEVRGYDISKIPAHNTSFETVIGDIKDKKALNEALDSIDVVIHLIAMHHDFGVAESDYYRINEQGTKDLLECCTNNNVRKVVFFSSVAVYGTQDTPTDETTTPHPDSPYGKSKLAAEKVIQEWYQENTARQIIIIRPTVVFGPHNYANMYNLINQITRGRFIFVGDGKNIKSVAYVENLVEATIFLLQQLKPGIDVFNYSDNPQMNTKQIVETIYKYTRISEPMIKLPYALAVALCSPFDLLGKITGYNFPITAKRVKKFCTSTHHRADKILKSGFKPPVSLNEGFQRTIDWFFRQNN